MPLVTVTVQRPKSAAFKTSVLQAVHAALVAIGVPATDRFQRVLELTAEDFRFDPGYPDVKGARNEDFVLIEVLLSVGRSVKVKRQFIDTLLAGLSEAGHDPENVMLVLKETAWENWVFAGGRQIHV
ncbi:MAG: tautomerase family protein [Lysobacteraceae bacterium]|nr:MAG: tautomerase family protein [Xanthomonadaceae bacterium]